MMAAQVRWRLVWDKAAIKALKTEPGVVATVLDAAQGFAAYERALAPIRTGAGAASIAPHESRSAGAQDVGWDAAHHYMVFPNYGTKFQFPPQFFAQRALARYKHT